MGKQIRNKGITLIALVITIIVLLILAGVSIAMLTGENGILNQANKAKEESKIAEEEEKEKLNDYENKILEYTGKLPETETTKPYLPSSDFSKVEGTDLTTGLVIKDKEQNSYVWVEVPKTIYTTTTSSEDYSNIEKDMQNYTSVYRKEGYTDNWYEGCGIATENKYNTLKNRMLKSVYENGGFWISQYEIGTETVRKTNNDSLTMPMSKENAYPYNRVTHKQAQELAMQMNSGNHTNSLLFGIQWDLTLKYLETKGNKTREELTVDSTQWGNYKNAEFEIEKGKYSEDSGQNYIVVNGKYVKAQSNSRVLTTGIIQRNSALNIYDLAGNIWEWTLEKSNNVDYPCIGRGGGYDAEGNVKMPVERFVNNNNYASSSIGIRVTLY